MIFTGFEKDLYELFSFDMMNFLRRRVGKMKKLLVDTSKKYFPYDENCFLLSSNFQNAFLRSF